jgi:hypothetical protein
MRNFSMNEMRKMLDLRNRWALLAGLPAADQIAVRHSSKQNEQQDWDSGELELRPRPHGGSAGSGTLGDRFGAHLRRWT